MNIAIVSTTAQKKPFLISPDDKVRGYAAFACLFRDDKTWNVSPEGFKEIENDIELIIFIPSSQPEYLAEMIRIAQSCNVKKLCQDSDPPTGWLWWFPSVTTGTIGLFNSCDIVITHSQSMVSVTQSLTRTPVKYLPEPSYLASYKEMHSESGERRKYIIAATTHCATYNTNRNAMSNYAVINSLKKKFPEYIYGIIANTIEAMAGDLKATEDDLLKTVGLKLRLIRPGNRYELFDVLSKTKLFVNLDYTNAVGHWHIDCAAMKIPVISTLFPDAGNILFPELSAHPFDILTSISIGEKLLTDHDYCQSIIERAYEKVSHYSFDHVREMFLQILDIPISYKPKEVGPKEFDDDIILEIGSGENPHEDVTHCIDVRNFSGKVGDRIFIKHDLNDLPLPFSDSSIRKAYMSHVLEHFPRKQAIRILTDVYRILSDGGTLEIDLPNASKAFEYGVKVYPDIELVHPDIAWRSVTLTLWSDPSESPFNLHRYGWNHFTLERVLTDIGFEVVSKNEELGWAIIQTARKWPTGEENHKEILMNEMTFWVRDTERTQGDIDVLNEVVKGDVYELEQLELNKQPIIVDIGAHIGSFMKLAKKIYPDAIIICIEPNPQSFSLLQKNALNLSGIILYQAAIRYDDDCLITDGPIATGGGFMWPLSRIHEVKSNPNLWVADDNVKLMTLEQIIEENNLEVIDLLKTDCECSEMNIFENIATDATNKIQTIVGEYHGDRNEFLCLAQTAFPDHEFETREVQESIGHFKGVRK